MTHLPDVLVATERVRVQGDKQALVASKSQPGQWHNVSWEWSDERGHDEWVCTCMGFQVRHECRHVRVIDRWNAGKTKAEPIEDEEVGA